jgi:hypothetical protein
MHGRILLEKKTNMQQNLKPRQKNCNGGQKERVSG